MRHSSDGCFGLWFPKERLEILTQKRVSQDTSLLSEQPSAFQIFSNSFLNISKPTQPTGGRMGLFDDRGAEEPLHGLVLRGSPNDQVRATTGRRARANCLRQFLRRPNLHVREDRSETRRVGCSSEHRLFGDFELHSRCVGRARSLRESGLVGTRLRPPCRLARPRA